MSEQEWNEPTASEVAWLYGENAPSGTAQDDSWCPRNLAEMEDRPPVEPTLGGLGIVYPGKRHVFSGPQESAKTLAAYVVGLHVVRTGGRVVLIDFEMGPWDAKTRLRELGATDAELGAFSYVEPDTASTPERVGALVSLEPDLVLVDAAAGAFSLEGLDDNARKDVETWANAWITPFWKAGVATIVLDHVTKNAETRGNYAIGSERKVGGADVHLGFTVVRAISRGDHGLYKVTTHKDRGGCLRRGHLCDFKLVSDPETHAISWEFIEPPLIDEEHPFRPTGLMEKASRWLELQPEPRSRNEVEKAVGGNAGALRTGLDILTAEGWIEETKGTNRRRLVRVVTAYREDEDAARFGSSQVRPGSSTESADSGSSVRPTPYGGDARDGLTAVDEFGSSQGNMDDPDDGIPF